MTVALITDQHLDGRKGSLAFWNYFEKFYEEIFFPTIERKGIKTIVVEYLYIYPLKKIL